jgi:hypothetical protein
MYTSWQRLCLLPVPMRGSTWRHLRQQAVPTGKERGELPVSIRVPQQRAREQGGDVAPHRTLASLTCPVAHVPVHCVHGMGRGAATARRQLGECGGQYKSHATQSPNRVTTEWREEVVYGLPCVELPNVCVRIRVCARVTQICSLVPTIGRVV